MSSRRGRSRSGFAATSASSSGTSEPCSPRAQVGVDAVLQGAEAQVLQVRALTGRERLAELGERRPAPEREGRAGRRPARPRARSSV